MPITQECPTCHQTWSVVTGIRKAYPGRLSEPVTVGTDGEDIYGNRRYRRTTLSQRWIMEGEPARVQIDRGETQVTYSWPCLCDTILTHTAIAVEMVDCQECAGRRKLAGSGQYVNPGHGQACPCCGHQGTHWVRRDRQGDLPRCLRNQ